MNSLTGHFLVASPHLADPNFHQSVILLVHHGDEGTFGLVLNHPTDSQLQDFWHTVSDVPCDCGDYLYVGGPVAGPLMALHTCKDLAELEVMPGLYFAAQREHIEQLVENDAAPYRLFLGHSGWGDGQLEHELAEGSWYTMPGNGNLIFGELSELWKCMADQVGKTVLVESLKIRKFPDDPSLN